MARLTICETSPSHEGCFKASVRLDNGSDYLIEITPPFDAEQEKRLEWYFEEHLRHPFLNSIKARDAAASVAQYGHALFEQIVGNREFYADYVGIRAQNQPIQIEIEGAPAFHALHWETLKDPKLSLAFALTAPLLRRQRRNTATPARTQPTPVLRLLLVTARPGGTKDVAYRTISRPLIEALKQADLRVQVDILRPGTYKALSQHLADTTAAHGAGHYHVIHFDTHGALLSHAQLQQGGAPDTLSYRYGRGELEPYTGQKAFLFFEAEEADTADADPVEARELAALLTRHGIPLAVLNACQSGKQIGTEETSLASHLLDAGVQTVLAMRYSVTVTAAKRFMTDFYRCVFEGKDIGQALCTARRELHNEKSRRAHYGQHIALEDWMLPVVYQNQALHFKSRDFSPEEANDFYTRQAEAFPEAAPQYGFFGRDCDVLAIERKILSHNLLLVQGMGGAGKTTLLRHLGHWWQRTQFVEQVFYFAYDEKSWNRQQILHDLAAKLLSPAEFHGSFLPLPEAEQQALLIDRCLKGHPHLLILDNLESVTGSHLAIAHTLSAEEQAKLKVFLFALRGGKTRVLLGSRSPEDWLEESFARQRHELPGLDPEAASALAECILTKHKARQHLEDPQLPQLLKLLAGFPLALEVLLPNLRSQTPQAILDALGTGADLESGSTEDKTRSILRCIEYSHSNLDPGAQALLACLAPFRGGVFTPALGKYSECLAAQPLLADLSFDRWADVLRSARQWGLMSPHPEAKGFLCLQPVFPYFLANRLAQSAPERHTAIEGAFCVHFEGYADVIYSTINTKEAEAHRRGLALANMEEENLLYALDCALAQDLPMFSIYATLSALLDARHEDTRALAVGEKVLARLETRDRSHFDKGQWETWISVMDQVASRHLKLKDFEAAQKGYTSALDALNGPHPLDPQRAKQISAGVLHQLGCVAGEQRQWPEAESYCRQALAIFVELEDRHIQASTLHQLGNVAQQQRQWPQAERYYQQALAIYVEFEDRHSQASTLHQLGSIAEEQRQWPQAERYYQQALAIYVEFEDRHRQAGTLHQLGLVAQAQRQWREAESYYQQALAIYVEFEDRHSQASTLHQLGRIAEEQRQWPEAEPYYLQALAIFTDFKDVHHAAVVLRSLARLWQASGDVDLPKWVAETLGWDVEDVKALFKEFLDAGPGGTE